MRRRRSGRDPFTTRGAFEDADVTGTSKPSATGERPPLTPALTAALVAVFESGAFPVYEWRGVHGFAALRVRIYEPPGMTTRAFKRLRDLGFLRIVIDDNFKQIWDISEAGIRALRGVNDSVRALSPQFERKRLAAGESAFERDYSSFATRRRPPESAALSASVHPFTPTNALATPAPQALTAADVRSQVANERLHKRQWSLGVLANECLEIIAAFLAQQVGSSRVTLALDFRGQQLVQSFVSYAPRSFDAPIPPETLSHLAGLLASACALQSSGLREGDSARIEFSLSRRKRDGAIRFDRLPEDAEIRDIVDEIRAAVLEVAPAGLAARPYLRVGLWGVGNIEWSSNEGYRGPHALRGPGRVKVNRAIWRAARGLPNCRPEVMMDFS